jgi:hypothetical protein
MAGIHDLGERQKVNGHVSVQRRRTPRYPFLGGIAQLTDTSGQRYMAGTVLGSSYLCRR